MKQKKLGRTKLNYTLWPKRAMASTLKIGWYDPSTSYWVKSKDPPIFKNDNKKE